MSPRSHCQTSLSYFQATTCDLLVIQLYFEEEDGAHHLAYNDEPDKEVDYLGLDTEYIFALFSGLHVYEADPS